MLDKDKSFSPESQMDLLTKIEVARRQMTGSNMPDGLKALRGIQKYIFSRREKIWYSLRAAAIDPEVMEFSIAAAEKCSANAFEVAEYQYWRCIQIYPFHTKLLFDYAYTLYRQDKLIDSEAFFRGALALGEAPERIRPFLQKVAERQMEPYIEAPICRFDPDFAEPINTIVSKRGESWLYPDVEGIRSLIEILVGQRNVSAQYLGKLLRTCRTSWDALIFIMETPEFRSANLDLCYLVGSMPRIQFHENLK